MIFKHPYAPAAGIAFLVLLGTLSACGHREAPPEAMEAAPTLPEPLLREALPPRVNTRISGKVEPLYAGEGKPPAILETGHLPGYGSGATKPKPAEGDISLDYIDTDIKEICRAVLGDILGVNYSIDPSVQGTATIRTTKPVARTTVLATLQGLLEQNGLTLLYRDGIFRVAPIAAAAGSPALAQGEPGSGSQIVPLHYASAKQLAAMLEPYAADGGRIVAEPARNVLIVTGTGAAREGLADLIRVFDVDFLAGQSYALFPVKSGTPAKVAADLQHFFDAEGEGSLGGAVRIVAIDRVNAVLVMSAQRAYIDRARNLVAQLDRIGSGTSRGLHVYFVQNGQATDLQPVLQRAFVPGSSASAGAAVETPSQSATIPPNAEPVQINQPNSGQPNLGQPNPGLPGLGRSASATQAPAAEPMPDKEIEEPASGGGGDRLLIIADKKRNALLIRATDEEYAYVEAALRKLDVQPLQVMIEATIAEVQITDALQYGTQFFLNESKWGSLLSAGPVPAGTAMGAVNSLFSGLQQNSGMTVAKVTGDRIQYVISALKSVTRVNVVSSPHLLILDNERARLQVGQLVPVLTGSATSVLTSGAPVVNSVDYHETGVILTVTPHVNSSGLVTLEVEQEVSSVNSQLINGIDSPIFDERKVKSRVVVQDGDTIAIAGLMTDNKSRGNSGIPWLKDIPGLGLLFSQENDTGDRTELLVLLTPKIVHDRNDARALTEELRRKLAPWEVRADRVKAKPDASAISAP